MDPADLPAVMTSAQLAEFLQSTAAAMAQDRYLGRGVPYTRIGRRVRYLKADVLKYLEDNKIGAA
ncbi:helix-turn-helix domain-containing protein [Mycolicibacterium frederiksbergense]|uniref:helix-turn-helix domain-containing protein n=1 Tax=Mycolicibacterium frederiksbergense TaxID=117567 RepID=UPI00265BF13A|nr:helix-turn-helix domain-containing protein [Mycolicibacterium frederiksbergense]MDO0975981.1 helix-turn-helix domain-containing protein [Mycolicibacterium frederiksbergense]